VMNMTMQYDNFHSCFFAKLIIYNIQYFEILWPEVNGIGSSHPRGLMC